METKIVEWTEKPWNPITGCTKSHLVVRIATLKKWQNG